MSLNKDSKVLFLVSSAINVAFGKNEKTRFAETINTINSINANFSNADIWLLDSGFKPIDQKWLDHLPNNVVIKDFWEDPKIIQFMKEGIVFSDKGDLKYQSTDGKSLKSHMRLNYIKNRTEIYVFNHILNNNQFNEYDRIFKISGRYALSPNFNIEQHSQESKIVFKKAVPSNQGTIKDVDKLYFCFCWSADPLIIKNVRSLFKNTEEWLLNRFDQILIGDMEHGIYFSADSNFIHEVPELGIFAKIGEGNYVYN